MGGGGGPHPKSMSEWEDKTISGRGSTMIDAMIVFPIVDYYFP